MSIGERIRIARIKSGLMQRELAAQLGTRQSRVSKWERDKEHVPPDMLREISQILYVKESWLRFGEPEQKPRAGADRKKKQRVVTAKYCGGCYHYCMSGMQLHCNYIVNTGHRRPCPAGEGCTERITPSEWDKRKQVGAEFNGYYPNLRKETKDAQ